MFFTVKYKFLIQSCSGWPNGAADTSSAYNTGGESCRSVSVTPDGVFLPTTSNSQMIQSQQSPRLLRRTVKMASPAVQRRPPVPQNLPTSFSRPPTVVLLPHDSPEHHNRPIHRTHQELPIPEDVVSIVSSTKTPRSIIRAPSAVFGALKGSSLRKLSISRNVQMTNRNNKEECEKKKEKEAEEYAKRFRIPSYSVVLKEEKKRSSFRIPVPQYFRSAKTKTKVYQLDAPEEEIEEVVDEEKMAANKDLGDTTVHYKWKVKRRCDGSRYIVKRPIRSQILKKREAQVYRERAPISTDDDAMSELKLGRFHTKEERKRILEREKTKKLLKLQQKMMEKAHPSEQVIYQMSQQKLARQKDGMVMDEFVTTREVLSSRTRPDGIHGVVSVTTV
uniref:TPX2 domain-containing protein n=1 Tax=Caenorhabditis tropicalis TaxID=1561998 RepID=A0A1I7TXH6_9PELO